MKLDRIMWKVFVVLQSAVVSTAVMSSQTFWAQQNKYSKWVSAAMNLYFLHITSHS